LRQGMANAIAQAMVVVGGKYLCINYGMCTL